jgi:predicted ATPase/transcriptional regulator with XRE-family HTH domain
MAPSEHPIPLDSFITFGDLLKYLRRRARLTQREVAIAVGYSEAQISRLEQNLRPPDLATLTALFIPALYLEDEPLAVNRLIELAAQARGEKLPQSGTVTFSPSVQREVRESVRTVEDGVLDNLPLQLTSFIGREHEMTEIKNLLGKARLVTLTGSGGCGKTRLALETAGQMTKAYPHGVWFIELAPISNPVHVPQTFITSLDPPESHDDSPTLALTKFLRTKHILLIVDNCEHILSETSKLIREILLNCPQVQVIATSREILNIPGEVRFRVPSLSISSNTDSQPESVQLFMDRAKTALPTFEFTKEDTSYIAQICRRLDGLPLAIELAAARISILSLGQIEVRLNDRFRLLTGGQVAVPRHQTLRATLEWSHDLLSDEEQVLFRRLSVFAGGWTLESANFVCGESGSDILDPLAQLVNKSLVIVERQPDTEVHYTMLETIRELAREKLDATHETEGLRARHFNYFLRTAEQSEARLFAAESSLDWAEAEIDNMRVALAWALERGTDGVPSEERTGRGLELMSHVWPLWLYRGYLSEGSEWMKQLLAAHTVPTLARARALLLAADFARGHGDYTGQVAFIQESLALARQLGDKKRIGWALMEMAAIECDHDHYPEAIPLLVESLQMFQELNEDLWVSRLSFFLSETYIANGNLDAAKPLIRQGLVICRAADDRWHIASGLECLGNLERLEGHFLKAREFYSESLNLRVEVMDRVSITYLLKAFAQLDAAQGEFERSAVLWGAAEKLQESLGFQPTPLREKLYTSLIPTAREDLGEKSFTETWDRGRAMKFQEAIDYALK